MGRERELQYFISFFACIGVFATLLIAVIVLSAVFVPKESERDEIASPLSRSAPCPPPSLLVSLSSLCRLMPTPSSTLIGRPTSSPPSSITVFTNARLVGSAKDRSFTVVVRDGVVASVEASDAAAPVPKDAEVHDLNGEPLSPFPLLPPPPRADLTFPSAQGATSPRPSSTTTPTSPPGHSPRNESTSTPPSQLVKSSRGSRTGFLQRPTAKDNSSSVNG
jgi:hypothetical protein